VPEFGHRLRGTLATLNQVNAPCSAEPLGRAVLFRGAVLMQWIVGKPSLIGLCKVTVILPRHSHTSESRSRAHRMIPGTIVEPGT